MSLLQQLSVSVMRRLFTDRRLLPIDVKVFGVMMNEPGYSVHATARKSGIPAETFRRSTRRLLELGWAYPVRLSRGVAVIPWLPAETEEHVIAQLTRMQEGVTFRGEWLMRCLLDLLLRNFDFIDNARPEWLVTGDGSGRLELDRWYVSENVAFEFQGPQHYRLGTPYTATVDMLEQRQRLDAIKAQLCRSEGIELVYITASDLSIEGMHAKLAGIMPVVPAPRNRPLTRYLERQCRSYRNYIARADRDAATAE